MPKNHQIRMYWRFGLPIHRQNHGLKKIRHLTRASRNNLQAL